MPDANIYLTEISLAVAQAMHSRGARINIWSNIYIALGADGVLKIFNGWEEACKMLTSIKTNTIYFSKIKTIDGYEKKGLGGLMVALDLCLGVASGCTAASLGEMDTSGGFWAALGFSEAQVPISEATRRFLAGQKNAADKRKLTIDPRAVLVSHPLSKNLSTGMGKQKQRRGSLTI